MFLDFWGVIFKLFFSPEGSTWQIKVLVRAEFKSLVLFGSRFQQLRTDEQCFEAITSASTFVETQNSFLQNSSQVACQIQSEDVHV